MGILNKLFGSEEKEPKKEKKALPWQELTTIDQLDKTNRFVLFRSIKSS